MSIDFLGILALLCLLVTVLAIVGAVILVLVLRRNRAPRRPQAIRRSCPLCGVEMPPDAPEGLCARCLLRQGMSSEGVGVSTGHPRGRSTPQALRPGELATAGYHGPPTVPSLAELAAHFPQLEILELLGQGGMGAVYKARQPKLDRLVAVKILPAEAGRDPAFAERFMREARALARLSHPNVVAVHDFGQTTLPSPLGGEGPALRGEAAGEDEGLYYFIMEYVDGVNLRQLLRQASGGPASGGREAPGALTPEQALQIVPQICAALQYAHDESIVHRDIKPENILIDKRGRVKIADFGLAKILSRTPAELTLTGMHQVMGTVHYMAPEQMERPHAVDHRADIYSLGVVFYEMLTGELPLGKFSLPSQKAAVDARLDEVVLKALEKEPDRRYQQATELKTDVETITSGVRPAAPVIPVATPARGIPAGADAEALQRVEVPGMALMFVGILGCLAAVVTAVVILLLYVPPMYMFAGVSQKTEHWWVNLLPPVGGMLLGGIVALAGFKMRRLEAYGFCVIASFILVLTFYLSPLGLWALWVLTRPDVRGAFLRRRLEQRREPEVKDLREVEREVRAAAGGLLAAGILHCIPLTPILAGAFLGGAPPPALAIVSAMIGLAGGILVCIGSGKMKGLEAYEFCVIASILAMIPWSLAFVVGLPLGIWALLVLLKPEVKAAFLRRTREEEKLPSKSPAQQIRAPAKGSGDELEQPTGPVRRNVRSFFQAARNLFVGSVAESQPPVLEEETMPPREGEAPAEPSVPPTLAPLEARPADIPVSPEPKPLSPALLLLLIGGLVFGLLVVLIVASLTNSQSFQEATIDPQHGGNVRGEVTLNGFPAGGATVEFRHPNYSTVYKAKTFVDGTYECDVPEGKYDMVVSTQPVVGGAAGQSWTRTVEVLRGRKNRFDVDLGERAHILNISMAYVVAMQKLGRPPKNATELEPFLKEHGDPDKLLRSPRDLRPYVIHWGIDPREETDPPVLAYEQIGTSGRRQVLLGVSHVQYLTLEELQQSQFPTGFKPPSSP